MVGGVGVGAASTPKVHMAFTWYIEQLQDDQNPGRGDHGLIYAKSCVLPAFDAQVDSVMGASNVYPYSKSVAWSDCKITFVDTSKMLPLLIKWRKSVWDPGSGFADLNKYAKISIITQYLPDGSGQSTFRLINSWPRNIRYGDSLSYDSSDVKTVEVSLAYTWCEEKAAG